VESRRLAALPAAKIALAVETGNEQNAVGFNLVKRAIGKSRHWGASPASMNMEGWNLVDADLRE
jgi:hypothetical protein